MINHKRTRGFKQYRYKCSQALWDWVILFLVIYTAIFTPYVAVSKIAFSSWQQKCNAMPEICRVQLNCISKEWSGACLSSQAFLPNVLIMPSVTDVALKAICGTNKYKLHHKYKKFKQQNYNLKNKNRARFHLSSQAFLLNEPGYSDKNTEPYGSDPIVIIDLLGEQFVFSW